MINNKVTMRTDRKKDRWIRLYLCLAAISVITICSKSSPLYPINDWVDANCFFTVGKAMFNGQVLYRDIYEQKGPLLYFLHGLGWLLSHRTFVGIWLLEIAACYGFLYYAFRILALYFPARRAAAFLPASAAVIYTSSNFCHGDGAEELCLPFLAYGLYISLKALKNKEEPDRKEYFLIGVTSACVLWIKYSMLGFYLGWVPVLAAALLLRRKYRNIGQMVLYILLGVLAATLPFFLYFAVNGAVEDWLTAYFYNNIFLYSDMSSGVGAMETVSHIAAKLAAAFDNNTAAGGLILLGAGWLLFRSPVCFLQVLFTLIGLAVSTYARGKGYNYYSMIFQVYTFLGAGAAAELTGRLAGHAGDLKEKAGVKWTAAAVMLILCAIGALENTQNRYLMFVDKADMPQYKFAAIMESEKENPTLLNYGFLDGGFYTAAGILPNCKYFCGLNIKLPELTEMQNYYVKHGLVDYVVTRTYEKHWDNYEKISEAGYYFEGRERTYYLYRLRE